MIYIKKKIQGIYVIRNIINDNCYVGQSIDVKRRWYQHRCKKNLKSKYHLYRAFNKYGIENFKFEVIEYVKNIDDLTIRELFWYNKLEPEYNQMEPREPITAFNKRPIYQIDKNTLKILNEYESVSLGSRETNTPPETIVRVCKKKLSSSGGFYWCYKEDYDNWEPTISRWVKKVKQLDKETLEVINTFSSIKDVEDELKIHATSITQCCKNIRKSAGGYKWCYDKGSED